MRADLIGIFIVILLIVIRYFYGDSFRGG